MPDAPMAWAAAGAVRCVLHERPTSMERGGSRRSRQLELLPGTPIGLPHVLHTHSVPHMSRELYYIIILHYYITHTFCPTHVQRNSWIGKGSSPIPTHNRLLPVPLPQFCPSGCVHTVPASHAALAGCLSGDPSPTALKKRVESSSPVL